VVIATPRPFYSRERTGTHFMEAGWAPGPVWPGAENLAPNGILSPPDQPVASRYTHSAVPGHHILQVHVQNYFFTLIMGTLIFFESSISWLDDTA
jgi:hypothetical protein